MGLLSKELVSELNSRAMMVGEYQPDIDEHVSDDGSSIICNICGKRRFSSKKSKLLRGVAWILDGDGCSCQKELYKSKVSRRDEYNSKKSGDQSQRRFEWDYCMQNWMLASVPKPLLNTSINSRFYMQNYTDGVKAVRQAIFSVRANSELKECLFLYGPTGSLKTSMLCCMRKELLDYTIPAIMVNVYNLIRILATESLIDQKEKLYEVDVLLVDDLGLAKLTERQSAMLENIFGYRRRCSKGTVFASKVDLESLQQRGYSKPLIGCIDNSGKTWRIEMQQLS